ncbi:hypothetical protein ACFZDP_49965 [Streptomyces mirabilis]
MKTTASTAGSTAVKEITFAPSVGHVNPRIRRPFRRSSVVGRAT